jgi:hypothetical protein
MACFCQCDCREIENDQRADARPDVGLVRRKTALLFIDMQREFLEPGGFGAALGNDVTGSSPRCCIFSHGISAPMPMRVMLRLRAELCLAYMMDAGHPVFGLLPAAKSARIFIDDFRPFCASERQALFKCLCR